MATSFTLADFTCPIVIPDGHVDAAQPEKRDCRTTHANRAGRWSGWGARQEVNRRVLLARQQPEDLIIPPFRNTTGSIWRTCEACGDVRAMMRKCSGCRLAHYCSTTCQKKHWRQQHKCECSPDLNLPQGRAYTSLVKHRLVSEPAGTATVGTV